MTDLTQAARQALEALEEISDDYADRFDLDSPSTNPGIKSSIKLARAAITALRAALEAPQAPVAWRFKVRVNDEFDTSWQLTKYEPPQGPRVVAIEPLYAHPPAQPQGWVLVPEKWTREMRHAFIHAAAQTVTGKETAGWEAALAARPKETT